jgi:sterol desaturase/sphingolipid hydroxylase (fatty acid hydroxylase superfamily)
MTLALVVAVGLPIALLERLPRLRFRPAPFLRACFASDTIYLVTGYVAGGSLALAYVTAASRVLGTHLGLPRVAAAGAPRWLSVPLALVALDLGNYVAHWCLHRSDWLWEFHKVHHSSPTLDWLATFRSHLVEQALRRLVAPVLLIVAGFPLDAVALAATLFLAWAMLDHSNLRLPLRFLEPIFVTPRLHRLHHVPRTAERNLGTVLTLWDRLRGTLVIADPSADAVLGIPGETGTYPQGWARQLAAPVAAIVSGGPRWARSTGRRSRAAASGRGAA